MEVRFFLIGNSCHISVKRERIHINGRHTFRIRVKQTHHLNCSMLNLKLKFQTNVNYNVYLFGLDMINIIQSKYSVILQY